LKEKLPEHPLVFKLRIPIKKVKIILIIPMFTDLLMQIIPTIKNMVFGIIGVAEEALPVKLPTGLLVVPLQNNSLKTSKFMHILLL
jgi:hypothetical protein